MRHPDAHTTHGLLHISAVLASGVVLTSPCRQASGALRAANARLREANARLRQVAEAKDTEIAALRAALEASQARQAEVIRRLELRAAELERRAGMDSRNSSIPPSKESLAAKARRKAARRASLRERSKQRKPGGQPGHEGSGLEPEPNPDRTEQADPPAECRSCGADLAGAGPAGRGWGQVWDIPPVRLEKVHWLLPKLRCRSCGKVTCPDPPDGQAGTVVYGPNVNAAAVLLNSEGNVPVATPTVPSRTPSPPGRAPSTLTCSRTCGNATTPRSTGVRSPTGSATGTTARTTPATSSPAG